MIVRYLCRRVDWNCRYIVSLPERTRQTCLSYSTLQAEERDPALYFFDKNIQEDLRTLTRVDYKKLFRERKDGQKLRTPTLKFMTDKALQAVMKKVEHQANIRLQMPPIVKVRSPSGSVISKDPALQGYETSTLVFTDISQGVSDRKRLIVVRETDGTLRHATWTQRERCNQIYFPVEGKELSMPKMFAGEHLQSLLDRGEYEYVLDRACVQFEPDDEEYQRVAREVYSHINNTQKFDSIRSTRHFGCLVFHLIWENDIDNLLLNILGSGKTTEARILIELYQKIRPESRTAIEKFNGWTDLDWVLHYARCDSMQQNLIERTVNSYKEMEGKIQRQIENMENMENMKNTESMESMESMENTQSIESIENTESTENTENIDSPIDKK